MCGSLDLSSGDAAEVKIEALAHDLPNPAQRQHQELPGGRQVWVQTQPPPVALQPAEVGVCIEVQGMQLRQVRQRRQDRDGI